MTTETLVPTAETRKLAARMVRVAQDQGYDAGLLVRDVARGQEAALVATLAVLAAGKLEHPVGGPRAAYRPTSDLDVHNLIACPRCKALIYQRCKTANGNDRHDHPERIVERRCRCGKPLPKAKGRYWCDDCRAVHKQEQNRDNSQAWRDRQKRTSEAVA